MSENVTALWGPRLRLVRFSVIICAKLSQDNTTIYQAKVIGYKGQTRSSWAALIHSVDGHERVYLALEDLLASSQVDIEVATGAWDPLIEVARM